MKPDKRSPTHSLHLPKDCSRIFRRNLASQARTRNDARPAADVGVLNEFPKHPSAVRLEVSVPGLVLIGKWRRELTRDTEQ